MKTRSLPSTNPAVFKASLVARLVTLCGLASAVALSTGCDRRTPSGKAVSSSSTKLQTVLSPATSGEGGATYASKQYDAVISDVKGAAEQGLAGENSAAKLLQAESQLGLAEQPFSQASRLEHEIDNRGTVLRSVLTSWITENSNADAAALYNPAETIAKAQTSAKEFDAKADVASKRRDKLAQDIKGLEGKAGEKLDLVKAEETAIAQMRDQAGTLKATEAAKVIEQAAERRKSADKVRTEGSLFQAQADQLQPQFREAELLVQQFQAQAKTYRDTIDAMQKQDAAKKEEVSKARSAAGVAATELDRQLEEMNQLRSGKLAEAYAAATQAFQSASRMIKEAQSDQPFAAAKITQGNIQQGLGDAYWSQAQGLLRYESLLQRLATVKPALPKAAAYLEEAGKTKQAAADALAAAKEAYEAASTAYTGAKLRGDAQERLDLLGSKLTAISQITAGEGMDALASLARGTFKPKEEAAPADAPAAEEGAAAAAPVEADPNAQVTAALDSLLNAIRGGDEAALSGMVEASSPALQTLMVAQLQGVGVLLKLDAATVEKFQGRFSEKLLGLSAGMGQPASFDPAELAKLADLKGADLSPTVTGDTASLQLPGVREPLLLKNVEGTWKVVAPEAANALPAKQIELTSQMTAATNEVMTSLTGQVQDGSLASMDALMTAFQMQIAAKIMPLMQQMQQGGPGGGGGGGG